MSPTDARVRAAELGIPFDVAEQHYDSLRAAAAERIGRARSLRERIYRLYGGRLAFHRRYAATGDHATIPQFDVWASSASADYPELLGSDDPAAELWAFLQSPAERPPSAAETWEAAFQSAAMEAGAREVAAADDFVPVAEAAALADVSEYWVRSLVSSGRIPGRRIGGRWIVSRTAAAAFRRHPSRGRPRRGRDVADCPF